MENKAIPPPPEHDFYIMNVMSHEIGHMLSDASYCKEVGVTQDEIMEFLSDIIKENELTNQLKDNDLDKMKDDIGNYFDGVTGDKNRLIAEMGVEASLDIILAAAQVAAEALAEVPFVGFGISAAMLLIQAGVIVLQHDITKLEGTVVEEISNSDTKINKKYPSFKQVKSYTEAVCHNSIFCKKMNLMGQCG